jgi:hypothetical protein
MDDCQLCHIKRNQIFIKKRLMQTQNHVSPSCQQVDGLQIWLSANPCIILHQGEHTKCAILIHTNEDSSMKYGIIILSWFTNSQVNPKPNANQRFTWTIQYNANLWGILRKWRMGEALLHIKLNSFYPCVHSSFTRVVWLLTIAKG